MSKLKEIHDYLVSTGRSEEEIISLDSSSVNLSMEIMEYAHRGQIRENGVPYMCHPLGCLQNYYDLIGIVPNDHFHADTDLMHKYGIPFEGVQEVCLLHDVIEDTDMTIEDVEEIFDECKFGDYFRKHIKCPLLNITHDESVDYQTYLNICMENPVSALCKLMDLQNNLYVLSLTIFDEYNYQRAERYLSYMYLINSKYHFIENACLFKKAIHDK